MNKEAELRSLALNLVDEFYENQGQGVLNNLNKKAYGNVSSDRDKLLSDMKEQLSDYQDERGNEISEVDKVRIIEYVQRSGATASLMTLSMIRRSLISRYLMQSI